MSDWLTVSIDAKDGATLRGRAHFISFEVCHIPHEPIFPVQLAVDAWERMKSGLPHLNGERWHVSDNEASAIAAGMELRDEFAALWSMLMGKQVPVSAAEYALLRRDFNEHRRVIERQYGVRLSGSLTGVAGGGGTAWAVPDRAAFRERTAAIITQYAMDGPHNVPEPDEDDGDPDGYPVEDRIMELTDFDLPVDQLPFVGFTATFSDPRYLTHMAGGMRWSTGFIGADIG
ncbi:hypothetical protein ABT294_50450 [Nonomuraea sp. NPDC000554]|uniref:hypothetical protein n=1 Tax=Nonomuraea sp. NPDC000554 TaxID=3154259 RepID=UPI003325B065